MRCPIRSRCQVNNAVSPQLIQSSQYVTIPVAIRELTYDSHWVFTIRSPYNTSLDLDVGDSDSDSTRYPVNSRIVTVLKD